MFPHCVFDASHTIDPSFVSSSNLPHMIESSLIPSQPDPIIDSTPSIHDVLAKPVLDSAEPVPNTVVSIPSLSPTIEPMPVSSTPDLPVLRRSTRPHHPLAYLSDYSCKAVSTKPASGLPYDISNVISYSYLGPQYSSFVMAVSPTPSKLISFS